MKQLRFLVCLLAVAILLPAAVFADASNKEPVLSDDIYAFEISLEGVVYSFPASFSDFDAAGWKFKNAEDAEVELAPNYFGCFYVVNGPLDDQIEATLYILNTDINTKLITDCAVGGIDVATPYSADKRVPVAVMAQGIELGKANQEDIIAAYGEPSSLNENEEYKTATLTYTKKVQQDVSFRMNEDVLHNVTIRNFIASEEKGEVSDEVPEEVTNYVAPTELGDDLTSQIVEYDGDLYRLPAPISAFEANGWKVMDYRHEYIPAKDSSIFGVSLMRNNQTSDFTLYNPSNVAILPENGLVSVLPPSGGGDKLVLPAGIKEGSTSEEVLTAYDGVIKLLSEREEYNTYTYSDRGVYWVTIDVDNTTKLVTDLRVSAP